MPRWDASRNRFVRSESITPVASASRNANGDSGWLSAEDFATLNLTLDVTAVSGTPTLDVVVETASTSGGANTRAVTGSPFAQKTGVSSERKSFTGLDAYYRVRWTIGGGSPNVTFSVSGEGK